MRHYIEVLFNVDAEDIGRSVDGTFERIVFNFPDRGVGTRQGGGGAG